MSTSDSALSLHGKRRILIGATGSVASVKIPIIVQTLLEARHQAGATGTTTDVRNRRLVEYLSYLLSPLPAVHEHE